MIPRVLVCTLATGCIVDRARYEDRQREICDAMVGCDERPWWPDTDLDGWGDGSEEPVFSAQRPGDAVRNRADCDDTDPANTADLGLCPEQFGAHREILLGTSGDGSEWVGVRLEQPLYAHEAIDRCEGWGGALGAPPDDLDAFQPLWVVDSPPLPSSWQGVPVDELAFGPVVFAGGLLQSAEVDTQANVACIREPADPADFVSYAGEVP